MDGLRFAWRNRVVRTLIIALFVGVAFAGLDDVALVFLVRDTLDGSPLAYGLVTGAYGIGMLLGSLGLTWKGTAAAAGTVFLLGWVASGTGAVLTGIAPVIALVAVGQAVAGVGNAVEVVAMDTLVQQAVPREMLGRVFGLVGTGGPRGTHAGVRGRGVPRRPPRREGRVPDRGPRRAAGADPDHARAPSGRSDRDRRSVSLTGPILPIRGEPGIAPSARRCL